jgi:hypothetical protein
VPLELFKESRKDYDGNFLIKYLIRKFGVESTVKLIERYHIGTSNEPWKNATIFWQIDEGGNIRTGKIMLYNSGTGKRKKQPFNYISWIHKRLQIAGFEVKQCFFGQHLLRGNNMPVAIVESEKTAIIASCYLPQFIWLAVGGKGNLSLDRISILKGRNVTLFPDLNAFEGWSLKSKEFSQISRIAVSDLLEVNATPKERILGLDLADYLLRFQVDEFKNINRNNKPSNSLSVSIISSNDNSIKSGPITNWSNEQHTNAGKTAKTEQKINYECWSEDILLLEEFFNLVTLPSKPIKLYEFCTIIDAPLFLSSHLSTLKANNGNKVFRPFLQRLQDLVKVL